MGTFGLGWASLQSPALVGEDAGGFAVSHLDLGCHLIAGASPGWVGAQGHHGGCGQRLLLVTDWDGKTPASPGAMSCGLSPALASQPLLILPLMRMGFCKLKILP